MKLTVNKFSSSLFLASLILLAACSGSTEQAEEKASASDDVKVTFTEEVGDQEKYVANIAIEGMACEMMCGSKIAGTLEELDGVNQTGIDFKGEGEINHALVEFDATVISEQEMINAVHSIANGHYKVSSVEVKHIKKGKTTPAEAEDASAYAPKLEYSLPNVFSVFTALF